MYLAILKMKRMNLRKYIGLVAILLVCVACPSDDDNEPVAIPIRDRGEQSILDDEILQEYLQTHFYNYEEFEAGDDSFNYEVVIDTIAGENSDKTPIIDRPELDIVTYDRFGTTNTLYILRAREGGSTEDNTMELTSNYTDSLFMNFRGVHLDDGSVFDGTANPIWLNLPATIDGFAQGLEGYRGDPNGVSVNEDGTSTYENFGSGAVFISSGLGYFNQPPPGIDLYANLIFTYQIFDVENTDHDGDFIPSIDEDIAGNNFLFDEEDNTDGDPAFNFRDPDDDNDRVNTRLEIITTRTDEDDSNDAIDEQFVSFLDTDGDGTPNHLDTDDDGDGRSTVDEIDINGATGVISFPDTDEDGIPDYLDSDS